MATTMTGKQLEELLDFLAPDRSEEQMESSVTIIKRHDAFTSTDGEFMAAGLYAYLTEYPEEGLFGPLGADEVQQ